MSVLVTQPSLNWSSVKNSAAMTHAGGAVELLGGSGYCRCCCSKWSRIRLVEANEMGTSWTASKNHMVNILAAITGFGTTMKTHFISNESQGSFRFTDHLRWCRRGAQKYTTTPLHFTLARLTRGYFRSVCDELNQLSASSEFTATCAGWCKTQLPFSPISGNVFRQVILRRSLR